MDQNKEVGALKLAKNAHYIDSSNLTLNEVCAIIEEMVYKV
jgi:cytidylate kinase